MNDEKPHAPSEPEADDGRRRFCQIAIGGMSFVSVGTVGYPVIAFLKLPASMTQSEVIEVLLSDLPDDGAVWNQRMGQQIVVIKAGTGARAFNGACPHLGCVVQWDAATRTFKCPCHGAVFNEQGEAVAGPVNKPLQPVAFEIKEGVLKIT